jgi:hypothetical protein
MHGMTRPTLRKMTEARGYRTELPGVRKLAVTPLWSDALQFAFASVETQSGGPTVIECEAVKPNTSVQVGT